MTRANNCGVAPRPRSTSNSMTGWYDRAAHKMPSHLHVVDLKSTWLFVHFRCFNFKDWFSSPQNPSRLGVWPVPARHPQKPVRFAKILQDTSFESYKIPPQSSQRIRWGANPASEIDASRHPQTEAGQQDKDLRLPQQSAVRCQMPPSWVFFLGPRRERCLSPGAKSIVFFLQLLHLQAAWRRIKTSNKKVDICRHVHLHRSEIKLLSEKAPRLNKAPTTDFTKPAWASNFSGAASSCDNDARYRCKQFQQRPQDCHSVFRTSVPSTLCFSVHSWWFNLQTFSCFSLMSCVEQGTRPALVPLDFVCRKNYLSKYYCGATLVWILKNWLAGWLVVSWWLQLPQNTNLNGNQTKKTPSKPPAHMAFKTPPHASTFFLTWQLSFEGPDISRDGMLHPPKWPCLEKKYIQFF